MRQANDIIGEVIMGKTVGSLIILGSALLGVTLMATPAAAQQGEPVKIGVLIGLTGSSAVAGNDSYKCMQMAVEEVNAAGGVLGRPIKLVVQDDEGRPKAGVDGANLLSDVEKVPVAIGGYSSGIALPAGQVFNEKKVVWVTDATTNKLKTIGSYVFDTAGLADQESALVDFVKADNADKKEIKLAGMFTGNAIGQDRDTVSQQRAKELGLTWVHSLLYTVGGTDFRAELQKVMDAKPDAILTDIYDNDAQVIQRQMYEMGITNFSMIYSYNPGAYGTLEGKLTEGIKGLDYVTTGPRADAFTKKYVAKYGKVFTDAWAPPFYDAVWIVANAINLANSLDSTKIRNAMWPAAYRYLGVSGEGDKGFNMYGKQAADQSSGREFKDGKLIPYQVKGSTKDVFVFRYTGPEGMPLDRAPTEEDFKKLYAAQ
jgi:branched-chain amino acid transport system substrate-binding protein